MNIEKIFLAVKLDDMNSPLISICTEIEKQGYKIKLEGIDITMNELDNEIIADLEKSSNEFKFELLKDGKCVQKFTLKYTGYHKICIKE